MNAVSTEVFLARRWKRFALVLGLFALGVCLFLLLNIVLGSVTIPLGDTVRIIFGGAGSDEAYSAII